jgi:hypothetical protein
MNDLATQSREAEEGGGIRLSEFPGAQSCARCTREAHKTTAACDRSDAGRPRYTSLMSALPSQLIG